MIVYIHTHTRVCKGCQQFAVVLLNPIAVLSPGGSGSAAVTERARLYLNTISCLVEHFLSRWVIINYCLCFIFPHSKGQLVGLRNTCGEKQLQPRRWQVAEILWGFPNNIHSAYLLMRFILVLCFIVAHQLRSFTAITRQLL